MESADSTDQKWSRFGACCLVQNYFKLQSKIPAWFGKQKISRPDTMDYCSPESDIISIFVLKGHCHLFSRSLWKAKEHICINVKPENITPVLLIN